MPAEAKFERDIDSSGLTDELLRIILGFLIIAAPAAVFIYMLLV